MATRKVIPTNVLQKDNADALLLWSRPSWSTCTPPSSIIGFSSFIDDLSKLVILFQFIRFFNCFCMLSQNSATVWYRASSQKVQSQERVANAVHYSLFGSKLLNHYNPVSTKYSIPSSYLNEPSFTGPMGFNTFSPCTAALGSCHKMTKRNNIPKYKEFF